MIKKSIVSIFCMLVITTGFSFGVLAEQNDKIVISESRILETEAVSNEIIYDSDAIPSSYMLDTLDQQQTIDADLAWCISENGYFAQSFIPTIEQLTRVELKLYKKGNPAGLTISIRSYLDNSDLTSKYLSSSSIPTNKTWLEFDFPDITVLPGKTYYIVWDPMGVPDNTTNFFWK